MILLLISFLLDNILSNYLTYSDTLLSWFQPCFFVVIIVFLFYYEKNKKKFFRQGILFTLLGSLFFGNSVILRLTGFLLITWFLTYYNKKYHNNFSLFFLALIFSLAIYHLTYYIILSLGKYINISLIEFFYYFGHFILLNLLVGIILYYFLGIKKIVN